MIPRINRLKTERDFARLFRQGKGVSGRLLTLKFVASRMPDVRVGFVVGTKVHKRSTRRNLLKRRMREVTRKRLPGLKQGYDLAFIAKPGATEADFQVLAAEMAGLLEKARLMK